MTLARASGLVLSALLATSAFADMTVRWNTRFDIAQGLPPQLSEGMKAQAGMKPHTITLQYRGEQAAWEQPPLRAVADYAKSTITLLHPESKSLATSPISAYPPKIDAFTGLPPEARELMEKIRFDVTSSKPGGTETIRGIKAEELEVQISVTIPTPTETIEIRILMSHWMPLASEVERLAPLRQYGELMAKAKGTMNPDAMLEKAFGAIPGVGEKLIKAMGELMKSSSNVSLRMKLTIAVPTLVKMAETFRKRGIEIPAGFDGTVGTFSMELAELSDGPVPDSAFEIPSGYETVSMAELVKLTADQKPHAH